MRRRFDGRVVIITGGAGGMGSLAAIEFAKEGAKVVIVDVDVTGINKVVEEITRQGGEALGIECDVSKADEVKAMVDKVISTYGRVDVLVNFVGILGRVAPLWELSEDEWNRVLEVNLKGVFLICREVIKYMINQRSGKVVNVSSVAGKDPNPYMAPYNASKAGVIALTRTLALEVAQYGINVNCVVPGITDTRFLNQLGDEAKQRSASLVPLGRLGKPEEIVRVVLFLASDEASFVTGAAWNVTGGRCPY